jgi:hypothetical protein
VCENNKKNKEFISKIQDAIWDWKGRGAHWRGEVRALTVLGFLPVLGIQSRTVHVGPVLCH